VTLNSNNTRRYQNVTDDIVDPEDVDDDDDDADEDNDSDDDDGA
jgi:hypothetical protein